MSRIGEILYCHVKSGATRLEPGHWFFHTGQYVQCAQAHSDKDGRWHLSIDLKVRGKPLDGQSWEFASIEDCKTYVADYFECPVREIKPSEFPRPDI